MNFSKSCFFQWEFNYPSEIILWYLKTSTFPYTGVYIFPFGRGETWLEGLWGKNMTNHDRVKNIPQRNGEETCMESKSLLRKLKQRLLSLMKIWGKSYILQYCQMFFWDFFSLWKKHIITGKNYVGKWELRKQKNLSI